MAVTILTPFQQEVLQLLSKSNSLTKKFYLTGGTALAEFYLQHRLSEDLDLFSEEEFSVSAIQAFVKKIVKELNAKLVDYRNFLGLHTFFIKRHNSTLKIDFNYYPFTVMEKGKKINKLKIDSLLDIAVNKMQTIATNPRSRDFIDLYCIIQETGWDVSTLRKQARIKFDHFVDPLHLGSRFLMAIELEDYPKLLITLEDKVWQDFWLKEAQNLKVDVLQ